MKVIMRDFEGPRISLHSFYGQDKVLEEQVRSTNTAVVKATSLEELPQYCTVWPP